MQSKSRSDWNRQEALCDKKKARWKKGEEGKCKMKPDRPWHRCQGLSVPQVKSKVKVKVEEIVKIIVEIK